MSEHDDEVLRRYRSLAREEPPASIDAAILAASRRSVRARPFARWAGPVSVAAVLVLALGLVLKVQREAPEAPMPSADTRANAVTTPAIVPAPPAPTSAAPAPMATAPAGAAASPPAQAAPTTPAPERREQAKAKTESALRYEPAPAQEPAPPQKARAVARPFAQGPAEAEAVTRADLQSSNAARDASSAATEAKVAAPDAKVVVPAAPAAASAPAPMPAAPAPMAAPPPASAADANAQGTLAPQREATTQRSAAPRALEKSRAADALAKTPADPIERELERIARLREEGHQDEADAALAAFRREHPDYRIAPAMWERVRRP
jgi:hypothetical protein